MIAVSFASNSEPVVVDPNVSSLLLIGGGLLLLGLWVSFRLVRRGREIWALIPIILASVPILIAVAIQSGILASIVGGVVLDTILWCGAYAYNSEDIFVRRSSNDIKALLPSWISKKRPPGKF